MREWRVRWVVRIRRAVPGGWPAVEVREHVVDTPGQLRALLEAARADRRVLAFPYEARRELVGEEPTTCGRGHAYLSDGSTRPRVDLIWQACRCGGHFVRICKVYDGDEPCLDEQIEPPAAYDCNVPWPRG